MTSIMDDDEVLSFVREKGGSARFITSVCAGALVLGSAGLVTSYKSACQRLMRDMLSSFGAVPVDKRVVVDRNRISGEGLRPAWISHFKLPQKFVVKTSRSACSVFLSINLSHLSTSRCKTLLRNFSRRSGQTPRHGFASVRLLLIALLKSFVHARRCQLKQASRHWQPAGERPSEDLTICRLRSLRSCPPAR